MITRLILEPNSGVLFLVRTYFHLKFPILGTVIKYGFFDGPDLGDCATCYVPEIATG